MCWGVPSNNVEASFEKYGRVKVVFWEKYGFGKKFRNIIIIIHHLSLFKT